MHFSLWYALAVQLTIVFHTHLASANVEKTIFIAPDPQPVPAESPAIDGLGLERLSPSDFRLRTTLNASFPTQDEADGTASWFYLEDLNPGQRYEVRICWLATQPTEFMLSTYSLAEIVSDQSLLLPLTEFSKARLADSLSASLSKVSNDDGYQTPDEAVLYPHKARHHPYSRPLLSRGKIEKQNGPLDTISQEESVLFLRISTAADYFTSDNTLMKEVPPVIADIILDPFLLNIFPRSLVPTAIYALLVAFLVYFIGAFLSKALSVFATEACEGEDGARLSEKEEEEKSKKSL